MNANELRIGNRIFRKGILQEDNTFHITKTSSLDIEACVMDENHFKPIELTKKWLIKFGFEKDIEACTYSILTSLEKFDYLFELTEYKGWFEPDFLRIQIKYVHQLQNLYFALTGEELTYND